MPGLAGAIPAAIVGFSLLSAQVAAAPRGGAGGEPDCFQELERGRGAEIVCAFPTRLAQTERAELRRLTGDLLQDASCLVDIRIERRLVLDALAAEDHVFDAPPQPMRCEIATRDGIVPITGYFAPRVVFREGRAIEATPGLDNVEGVPVYLAWPVVQYVNRSGTIRDNMLAIINALRSHYTAGGAGRGR
jgi:hypothetical protein